MSALTVISPSLPTPVHVTPVQAPSVVTVTLPAVKAASMVPAMVASMLMFTGSINQSAALTWAPACTSKNLPEVSTKPPSADTMPPKFIWPPCANNTTSPFWLVLSWLASIRPVLLITLLAKSAAACEVSNTVPPSALMAPPLSIKVSKSSLSTNNFTGPPKSKVTLLPAPNKTLPPLAVRLPSLLIFAAIKATVPPSAARMLP